MCGIVCAFDIKQKVDDLRPQVLEMAKTIVFLVLKEMKRPLS